MASDGSKALHTVVVLSRAGDGDGGGGGGDDGDVVMRGAGDSGNGGGAGGGGEAAFVPVWVRAYADGEADGAWAESAVPAMRLASVCLQTVRTPAPPPACVQYARTLVDAPHPRTRFARLAHADRCSTECVTRAQQPQQQLLLRAAA